MPFFTRRVAPPTHDDILADAVSIAKDVLSDLEDFVLDLHNSTFLAESVKLTANLDADRARERGDDVEADRLRGLVIEAERTKYRNEQIITGLRALAASPAILGKA